MAWLRWLWPKLEDRDPAERAHLQRVHSEAVDALADADARWPEVQRAAAHARRRLEDNHFGQLIEDALRARPNQHGSR